MRIDERRTRGCHTGDIGMHRGHQMEDVAPVMEEVIGDEPAIATPPDGLRTMIANQGACGGRRLDDGTRTQSQDVDIGATGAHLRQQCIERLHMVDIGT